MEDLGAVRAYEKGLQDNLVAFFDHANSVRERCGLDKLDSRNWPLRPLFLPRGKLHSVADELSEHLELVADYFHTETPSAIARSLGIDETLLERIYYSQGVKSKGLLSLARYDGYWHKDRFVVQNLRLGNGLILGLAQTGHLRDIFEGNPVSEEWCSRNSLQLNPFDIYIESLYENLDNPRRLRFALFSLSSDAGQLEACENKLCRELLRTKKVRTDLVDESKVTTDAMGHLRLKSDGSRFDGVLGLTRGDGLWAVGDNSLNSSEPPSLGQQEILSELPLAHPFACLALERGAVSWLEKSVGSSALSVEYKNGTSLDSARLPRISMLRGRDNGSLETRSVACRFSLYLVNGLYAGATAICIPSPGSPDFLGPRVTLIYESWSSKRPQ